MEQGPFGVVTVDRKPKEAVMAAVERMYGGSAASP
jgi:hypothetical protein